MWLLVQASHGFVDGQQITLSGGTYSVNSVVNSGDRVCVVRNTTTNTFELFDSDGTTVIKRHWFFTNIFWFRCIQQ